MSLPPAGTRKRGQHHRAIPTTGRQALRGTPLALPTSTSASRPAVVGILKVLIEWCLHAHFLIDWLDEEQAKSEPVFDLQEVDHSVIHGP